MKRSFLALILCMSLAHSCIENKRESSQKNGDIKNSEMDVEAIFQRVDQDMSGLVFENRITENLSTLDNLFNFDYFYNGAGVGLEDINHDGLLDIFLCGNQVPNKLFLNKGNLVFEDISEKAGINVNKVWSNGVAFVDINSDGLPDIYVSQGGPHTRDKRTNLLYINNGDLTFTEKAKSVGLADMGITTQSAFFDYDMDGDLDCWVMNENELYGVDPVNLYKMIAGNKESEYFNSSHLYRNDDGKFVDVTREAGIERPFFGLGLCIADINDDGWPDVYTTSDYYIPDALFINNGNGSFSDKIKEATNHISFFGMGVDIADVDNDGLEDIYVLDMSSSDHIRAKTLMASMNTSRFGFLVDQANFHHQYMFNTFQLNMGSTKFNEIAQLTQTANTDWSWSALLSDFDNDGYKDIFITNGYKKYALDNDLQQRVLQARKKYGGDIPLNVKKQLYDEMPSEKLSNIMYKNKRQLVFDNVTDPWGLDDASFSNGAAQGDLDNDGDLDLVVNNVQENAFLYQNLSSDKNIGNYLRIKTIGENSESFAKIRLYYDGRQQYIQTKRIRGYMSSQEDIAHFGLGDSETIDSLVVTWSNGEKETQFDLKANSTITLDVRDAVNTEKTVTGQKKPYFEEISAETLGIDFVHRENDYDDFEKEVLLPYEQSSFGPLTATADVNGDGLMDFYIGGASGQPGQIFTQTSQGFIGMVSDVFENDRRYEDMESVFFDLEGDGDMDLFVVSGGNEYAENSSYYADRLYLNNGQGEFSRLVNPVLESYPKSGKSVAKIDFDNDGDYDILVGNRIIPQNYPKHAPSTLYENREGKLVDVTFEIAPEISDFGIVNDIVTTDYDNDGWQDFILVGEWTPIGFFRNVKGTFEPLTEKVLDEKGWWFSVNETDLNNDGLMDYIVGNVGLNIKFTASPEKPFKVFSDDFDGDGINDIVLGKKYKSNYVPVRGRECSSQQMPFIKNKFPTYKGFAEATIEDIFGENLQQAYQGEITELSSIMLLNKGDGIFEKIILPVEAQFFPLLDCVFYDLNQDGFQDCILSGNIYGMEVETPRLDALSGTILISNGRDSYDVLRNYVSGLYLEGDIKSSMLLETKTNPLLISTVNDGRPIIHKLTLN